MDRAGDEQGRGRVVDGQGGLSGDHAAALWTGLEARGERTPRTGRRGETAPPSVLLEPLRLGGGEGFELVLEAVLAYRLGFELLFRRIEGDQSPAVLAFQRRDSPLADPVDRFAGLSIELRYADGRGVVVDDLDEPPSGGEVALVRYREELPRDGLWLWAMPLPPSGPVTLQASWPAYGIEGSPVSFEGRLLQAR